MFFRKKPPPDPPPAEPGDPMDETVLAFSQVDPFTFRDACQGVQIFGETGSGKTSGSGRYFATAYLRTGLGGLVLTANPDEADLWRSYAAETGRSADLVFFGPDHPHSFNFFQYESSVSTGEGTTRNLVDLFATLAEIDESTSKAGGLNEGFWQRELKKIIANSIDLLRFSGNPITLENIHRVIITAPISQEQLEDDVFQVASLCYKCGEEVKKRMLAGRFNDSDARDCDVTLRYWEIEFLRLDPRQRGSIISSFTGIADTFLRGRFRELFCESTTIHPEECFGRKIIILDMPVKRWRALGVYGQMVFKYCWQKAVERRRIDTLSVPVFLWADEAQYFINSHDVLFQTTARGSRTCTVYLTQNLPNYFNQIQGKGETLAHSLLGNLATKIFHSNTCAVTNKYAAELFSQEWQDKQSLGFRYGDGKESHDVTQREELRHIIEPREFSGMKSGGPANDFVVEAVVNKAGRRFNLTGTNIIWVAFNQRE